MIAAWWGPHLLSTPDLRSNLLLLTIIISCLPLCSELLSQIRRRNFGIDILAFVSILSAVFLKHYYWVATIVILMFSGGRALEEYATNRASSVLQALARRMPRIAHKRTQEGNAQDLPIGQVVPGDILLVYPIGSSAHYRRYSAAFLLSSSFPVSRGESFSETDAAVNVAPVLDSLLAMKTGHRAPAIVR